jgi:hypothetical protein
MTAAIKAVAKIEVSEEIIGRSQLQSGLTAPTATKTPSGPDRGHSKRG